MFVDSVVWIGAKLKRDQWYSRSLSIIKRFMEEKEMIVHVTDYIVLETVNFLLRKGGFEVALKTLGLFMEHERINVIHVDEKMLERIYAIFKEFRGLSITDASIVVAMQDRGINRLYSFDDGFDKIGWIERLEE